MATVAPCVQILQMQAMHPVVARQASGEAAPAGATLAGADQAADAASACQSMAMAQAPGVMWQPVYAPSPSSWEHLQPVRLVGTHGASPVFQVIPPEEATEAHAQQFVQLQDGSLMRVAADGSACTYVMHSYLQ